MSAVSFTKADAKDMLAKTCVPYLLFIAFFTFDFIQKMKGADNAIVQMCIIKEETEMVVNFTKAFLVVFGGPFGFGFMFYLLLSIADLNIRSKYQGIRKGLNNLKTKICGTAY